MVNPEEDGITHINIYSKGKTEIGRLLTNFARTPFFYPHYGHFESVEGFWYYYLTGCQHSGLQLLYGWEAKQEGKKLRDDRLDKEGLSDEQKEVILEAIRCKLRQNKPLLKMLVRSTLPFEHYYCYGGKVIPLPQYQWIVDEIERIRQVCKEHKKKGEGKG